MIQVNSQKEKQTNWLVCVGIIILFFIPYVIVNYLPLPRYSVPFLFGEERIPFLPWTFIIYISDFLLAFIVIRLVPPKLLLKSFLIILCMLFVGILFFVFFPIEYPRNLYPSLNSLVVFFRSIDGAGNCFPSLHVSGVLVLATCYHLIDKSLLRRSLVWTWTIAIIISVLTTKQHYAIDIIGGIALAIPFMFIMKKIFRKYYSELLLPQIPDHAGNVSRGAF